jgi:hypothetical protein
MSVASVTPTAASAVAIAAPRREMPAELASPASAISQLPSRSCSTTTIHDDATPRHRALATIVAAQIAVAITAPISLSPTTRPRQPTSSTTARPRNAANASA